MLHLGRAWALALSTLPILACGLGDIGEPQYCVVAVPVGGTVVYFKAEVWGFHGRSLVLSPNPDWHRMPSRDATEDCCPDDYWNRADTPPALLIRTEEDALHLWGAGQWLPPNSGAFPVKVVFHEVDAQTVNEMALHPAAHGVRLLPYHWPFEKAPARPLTLDELDSRGRDIVH